MPKLKAVDIVSKLVTILKSVEEEERGRAVRAALTLLGDESTEVGSQPGAGGTVTTDRRAKVEAKQYFDQKGPRTKKEELAVAARYREEHEEATNYTKADLQKVITDARRNFDARNFRMDLENARKDGLFTRGTGRDKIVLSHYGQNYVDTLPNREALKKLQKPKAGRRRAARRTKREKGR